MIMPNVAPHLRPNMTYPYNFDILGTVSYLLNDPDNHAKFTEQLYKDISRRLNIINFEAMPRYFGITVEKQDTCNDGDTKEYMRLQFVNALIVCFRDNLRMIPGLALAPSGEVAQYIIDAFPVLDLSPIDGDTIVMHFCFGI